MNSRGGSWCFAATANGLVRVGRQAWALFSLGTPRRSQPCPSLVFRLSLPDWERINVCCSKLPCWWSCSQQPWQMHKAAILEIGNRSSERLNLQPKTHSRMGLKSGLTPGPFGSQVPSPGLVLVGLAISSGGCLYPGSTPWGHLSPKTTAKVRISECIF